MNLTYRYLPAFLLFASATSSVAAGPATPTDRMKALPSAQETLVAEGYGKLPLSFEPNQGQTDKQVKFLSRGDGYSLFLASSEAVLSLQGHNCTFLARVSATASRMEKSCTSSPDSVLRMRLIGSKADTEVQGQDELPGKSNYFTGQNSSDWHTNVSNYSKVMYREVYPGIDLVYYGNRRQLEHDFIVAPGGDPKTIRLNFTGADRLSINGDGNLELSTPSGVTQLKKPMIYQDISGVRRQIDGRYVRKSGNEIGFAVGKYDRTQRLVIDPILTYATYFGGSSKDSIIHGIAADADGNAYVTGSTQSTDFPLANPIFYMPGKNYAVGFVSKISADGQTVLYSTFLGNASAEVDCSGIAVDSSGSAYISGYTASQLFPVVNALQPKKAGQIDAFVTKLNPNGSALEYSTYLGGGKEDYASAIAVDSAGAAYVTGWTTSSKFPTVNAFSTTGEVFVAKLDPTGSSLKYSTRLGGNAANDGELAFGIAVDSLSEAIVTGETSSADFPLKNPLFSTLDPGGNVNVNGSMSGGGTVFVTKLSSTGKDLVFSTFLGKGVGYGIATNGSGDAFLTGQAYSPNRFMLPNPTPSSTFNATFVTRLKADGSAFVYSRYLASSSFSEGRGIAADADGNAYVTGDTTSGWPLVAPIQPLPGSGQFPQPDAFLTKFDSSGSALIYSTLLGGSDQDYGQAIAIDGKGNVFVAGQTSSYDFPLKAALISKASNSIFDGFIAKIFETSKQLSITNTADRDTISPGENVVYNIAVTNTGLKAADAVVTITSLREILHRCAGPTCTFNSGRNRASVDLGVLSPGQKMVIQLFASALRSAGDYNLVTNTATVSTGPPLNEVDTATATTTVRQTADIAVYSSLVDSTNGLLHYMHTVVNRYGDNAHAVLLLDPLPASTTFVSATTTLGKCSFHPTIGAYGAVRCPLNNPVAGSSVQVDVFLQASGAACPTVTNTASVTSQSIDPQSADDSSTVVTQLPQTVCDASTLPVK